MRAQAAALFLALIDAKGLAATAYVTDQLVLGVYGAQNTQGERLATLHSGAMVETLATSGDATQVRLPGGTVGWVKTAYLTNGEPATVRVKRLQDELDRSGATTPALAEAAERSEVARLTQELAQLRSAAPAPASALPVGTAETRDAIKPRSRTWPWLATVGIALGVGFWLGYATLARRVKSKFGGLKVY